MQSALNKAVTSPELGFFFFFFNLFFFSPPCSCQRWCVLELLLLLFCLLFPSPSNLEGKAVFQC